MQAQKTQSQELEDEVIQFEEYRWERLVAPQTTHSPLTLAERCFFVLLTAWLGSFGWAVVLGYREEWRMLMRLMR